MCVLYRNSNTRPMCVPEGTEASFRFFPSAFFLTLSLTHTQQSHTMPAKTAGGPNVPHTEAVRGCTGVNVNRPLRSSDHEMQPSGGKHTYLNCRSVASHTRGIQ